MKTSNEAWSWIEGLRDGKWIGLYCYRHDDEVRLKKAFNMIQRDHAAGVKMQDELNQFSKFRIHPAGVYMDALITIEDIRQDINGENLARILSKFNQTECGVKRGSTGQRCKLPMFHEGKHSAKARR